MTENPNVTEQKHREGSLVAPSVRRWANRGNAANLQVGTGGRH